MKRAGSNLGLLSRERARRETVRGGSSRDVEPAAAAAPRTAHATTRGTEALSESEVTVSILTVIRDSRAPERRAPSAERRAAPPSAWQAMRRRDRAELQGDAWRFGSRYRPARRGCFDACDWHEAPSPPPASERARPRARSFPLPVQKSPHAGTRRYCAWPRARTLFDSSLVMSNVPFGRTASATGRWGQSSSAEPGIRGSEPDRRRALRLPSECASPCNRWRRCGSTSRGR